MLSQVSFGKVSSWDFQDSGGNLPLVFRGCFTDYIIDFNISDLMDQFKFIFEKVI